jgi:hypothetical protein
VPQPKIPKEVIAFVARYLPSVEHLEVFMLMQQRPVRSWSGAEVAEELNIANAAANDVLERLASDNFLDIKILNDVLYCFNPVTPALAQAAACCADSYHRDRIAMTKIVIAATIRPMHDFAEAFRIKKTKKDA